MSRQIAKEMRDAAFIVRDRAEQLLKMLPDAPYGYRWEHDGNSAIPTFDLRDSNSACGFIIWTADLRADTKGIRFAWRYYVFPRASFVASDGFYDDIIAAAEALIAELAKKGATDEQN